MMRRTIAGAAAIATTIAIVAGCGGGDDADDRAVQPEGEFDLAGAYDVAYDVCAAIGDEAVNPDPAIDADPESNPDGYAAGYAAQYDPPFTDAYRTGCLDGFDGRPKNPPG
jgi:hypothetical protein